MNIDKFCEDLKKQFNHLEINYLDVQKAEVRFQLRNPETGELHLHKLEYKSKDAVNLVINLKMPV